MFGIGMGEMLVIMVVGLLVFGPDRLPEMAQQAASFVRDLRKMVANARRDLSDSVGDLGIDKEDLQTLADLRNPRSFVRAKVLDGVDLGIDDIKDDLKSDVNLSLDDDKPATNGSRGTKTANGARSAKGASTAPPPFDPDAT